MSDWDGYEENEYEDEYDYAQMEPFSKAEIDEAAKHGPAVGGWIIETRAARQRALEQAQMDAAQAQIESARESKRNTTWARIGALGTIVGIGVAIVVGYLILSPSKNAPPAPLPLAPSHVAPSAPLTKTEYRDGPNVNFGCQQTNTSSVSYTAPTGFHIVNANAAVVAADGTKSTSANVTNRTATSAAAAATFQGQNLQWTGNCPGGGHGAVRLTIEIASD